MFCPSAVDEFFVKKIESPLYGYQDKVSFEDRLKEAEYTRNRYPTKVPLVIERHRSEKNLPNIDKIKWLVPHEMTLAQLSSVIKQRLKCPSNQQLFMTINSREFPSLLSTLSSLHNNHSSCDGFLYLTYSSQEVYG